jgi:replicative DNA helicase
MIKEEGRRVQIVSSRRAAQSLKDTVRARMLDPTYVWGIPWGFPTLDRMTGGIQKEEMCVLIARPGVGKSAFLGQVSLNVARYFKREGIKKCVRIITLEMSAESYQKRIACYLADVSISKVNSGFLLPEEASRFERALDEMSDLDIQYIDQVLDPETIRRFISDTRRGECGFWGLDHMQIISNMQTDNTHSFLTQTAHIIRELSRSVAPSLILSQMNRKAEERQDKRPQLSDIFGSDGIGQDARRVIGLYREDIYAKLTDEERKKPQPAEVIVLKANNGQLGTVDFIFHPTRTEWREIPAKSKDEL